MWIDKQELLRLSGDIRRIINGENADLRDNHEGVLSILKNDIHTLANMQNERIDALQRDKTALKDTLADISHQLKTPLTSMMLMADLLETAPPEKQAEFISNIRPELAKTQWLVSALLKMAKIDAGTVSFMMEQTPSGTIIAHALEALNILLEIKNQSVSIAGNTEIFCDPRWTAEALTNIIKNASEYSPKGSIIKIEAGKNPICAWISVKDSGIGISNTERASIFKRFEGSRSAAGTGIGLPLALSIMRGQGGDIQVENNEGAVFIMKFYRQA